MANCPKCGHWNEEDSAFCAGCGNPLGPAEKKPDGACPKCGHKNPENSAFCAKCGNSLSPAEKKPDTACPKCGYRNPDGNAFCISCGNPLNQAEQSLSPATQKPRAAAVSPEGAAPSAVYNGGGEGKKSKKGLIIGIIVAAAAAAFLLIFLFAWGVSVTGVWYDGTNRAVLEFTGGGNLYSYTAGDTQSGKYEYDKPKGEGRLALDGQIYDFVVVGDKLNLENTGIYLRADEGFDIEKFLNGTSASAPIPAESATPTEEIPSESTPAEETEVVEGLTLTLSFAFGDREGTYSGEMLGGLPNGQGTFSSVNLDGLAWTYDGMWVDGHCSGAGETIWEDGFARGGEYANDYVNGIGWQSWDGRREYEGSYVDAEFQGEGMLYNYHGTPIYSGLFNNGFIQESAEARAARIGAFKSHCTPYTYEEVLAACENDTELFAWMTGEVYEVDDTDYDNESHPVWVYIELPPGEDGQINYVTVRYWASEGETLPAVGQTVTVWGSTQTYYLYEDDSGYEWVEPVIEAWTIEAAA